MWAAAGVSEGLNFCRRQLMGSFQGRWSAFCSLSLLEGVYEPFERRQWRLLSSLVRDGFNGRVSSQVGDERHGRCALVSSPCCGDGGEVLTGSRQKAGRLFGRKARRGK